MKKAVIVHCNSNKSRVVVVHWLDLLLAMKDDGFEPVMQTGKWKEIGHLWIIVDKINPNAMELIHAQHVNAAILAILQMKYDCKK